MGDRSVDNFIVELFILLTYVLCVKNVEMRTLFVLDSKVDGSCEFGYPLMLDRFRGTYVGLRYVAADLS